MRIAIPPGGLTDSVVIVRPPVFDDLEAITAGIDDDEIRRWLPNIPNPYSVADARDWVSVSQRLWRQATPPEARLVITTMDGRLLGAMGAPRISHERTAMEFGWWLASWARGRGYATRALRVQAAWAFATAGCERIEVHVAVGNVTSKALAERVGFRSEGILRSWSPDATGGRLDMVAMSLLSDDDTARTLPAPDPVDAPDLPRRPPRSRSR